MSERQSTDQPPVPGTSPFSRSNLLTPEATAIAGFVFAVFSMLSQGSWSTALTSLFWGSSFDVGSVGSVMAAWGVGCLLMAVLGGWLASVTLRARDRGWESQLARAAVLVAGAGGLLAVLTIIGGVAHTI